MLRLTALMCAAALVCCATTDSHTRSMAPASQDIHVEPCDGSPCPAGYFWMTRAAAERVYVMLERERAYQEALAQAGAGAGWPPWAVILVSGALVILAGCAGYVIGAAQ